MASKKDNTMLYVGVAVLAFVLLNSKKSTPILAQPIAPGEPQPTPEQQQLAADIATGNVVLEIEQPPVVVDNKDYNLIAECNIYRDSHIPRFAYGNKCDSVFGPGFNGY